MVAETAFIFTSGGSHRSCNLDCFWFLFGVYAGIVRYGSIQPGRLFMCLANKGHMGVLETWTLVLSPETHPHLLYIVLLSSFVLSSRQRSLETQLSGCQESRYLFPRVALPAYVVPCLERRQVAPKVKVQ